jgi:hypothetical protein
MSYEKLSPLQHFQQLNVAGCEWETLGLMSRGEMIDVIRRRRLVYSDAAKLTALWRLRRLERGIFHDFGMYFHRIMVYISSLLAGGDGNVRKVANQKVALAMIYILETNGEALRSPVSVATCMDDDSVESPVSYATCIDDDSMGSPTCTDDDSVGSPVSYATCTDDDSVGSPVSTASYLKDDTYEGKLSGFLEIFCAEIDAICCH